MKKYVRASKLDQERVIFRKEWDPYMKEYHYLCIFPDCPANPGRYCCRAIWKDGYGHWTGDSMSECDYGYLRKCKIIHKGSDEAREALEGLNIVDPSESADGYVVVEKIMR